MDLPNKVALASLLLGLATWLCAFLFSEDIKAVSRHARAWAFSADLLFILGSLGVIVFWPVPDAARDPDAIYQFEVPVGTVSGEEFDLSHGVVKFKVIRPTANLNGSRDVEFRDWIIHCPDLKGVELPPGTFAGTILPGPVLGEECTLVRKR